MRQLIRDWWPLAAVVGLALGGLWVYSALHVPDINDLYSRAWHETKGGPSETDFYRARLGKKYAGSGKVIAYKRLTPSLVIFNTEGRSGIHGNAVIECREPEPFGVGSEIEFTAVVSEVDLAGTPAVLPRVTSFERR